MLNDCKTNSTNWANPLVPQSGKNRKLRMSECPKIEVFFYKNVSYQSQETIGLILNYNKKWILVSWEEDETYRYRDQATKLKETT